MRFMCGLVCLPLLLCACGGGGGGGGNGDTTDRDAAQQLLETCGVLAYGSFLDALDVAMATVDPSDARTLPIVVVFADQGQGSLSFEVDLGGDPAPELIGDIQFLDDQGDPASPPFDLNQLVSQGLDSLDQLVTQLLDGWSMAINFSSPTEPLLNAGFFFTFASSAVSGVTGNALSQGVECTAIFDLVETPLADLAPAFPTVDLATTISGTETALAGTTAFDGTNVAIVDVTVNAGTTVYSFAINLDTGAVTPVP